jgi:hypothetical protein
MILDIPHILATRRNHALEHATIHILSTKYPERHMAGHSNPTGFYIIGNVSTEDLKAAVNEAWNRLRAGESKLAIHPGCGTNLATSMVMSGTMAWFPMGGAKSVRQRLWLLPFAIGFAFLGYALSRPLGPMLQEKVTTEADLGDLKVDEIVPVRKRGVAIHRVITKN